MFPRPFFPRFIDYGAIKAPRDVRFLCHCVTKQIKARVVSEIMEGEQRKMLKYSPHSQPLKLKKIYVCHAESRLT